MMVRAHEDFLDTVSRTSTKRERVVFVRVPLALPVICTLTYRFFVQVKYLTTTFQPHHWRSQWHTPVAIT